MHIPTSFSEFMKLSFEERMEIFRLDPALRHLEQVLLRIGVTARESTSGDGSSMA